MEKEFLQEMKKTKKKVMPGSGKWIEKPSRSTILSCPICKGKYIKTRPQQSMCVQCLVRSIGRR
jgi:hypothetical protein